MNRAGDVTATIDNPRVAVTRLRLDAPASAYFLNPETGLRIDLLFDFPLPAAELAKACPSDESSLSCATRRVGRRPASPQENCSCSAFRPRRCRGCCVSRITAKTQAEVTSNFC